MKLVLIFGAGAVGKMSVGRALMEQTGLRLFHNHMTIEPVIEVFGYFDMNVTMQLREIYFREFAKSNNKGMIFTFMWAFNMQEDWDIVAHIAEIFEEQGGEVYYVELDAPLEVRLQRNETPERLASKASKRDVEASRQRVLAEEKKYRLVSLPGEIPFPNYLKINNSNLSSEEAAAKIKAHFDL